MLDIAIVGAGLSGLTCARLLHVWGYRVAVFDKSRGLGGRVATRRVATTCFDHGARFIHHQGIQTEQLLHELLESDRSTPVPQSSMEPASQPVASSMLISWPRSPLQLNGTAPFAENSTSEWPTLMSAPEACSNGYAPKEGMTAIAKVMAQGLDIRRQHRITCLEAELESRRWRLKTDDPSQSIEAARVVILAMPAPQIMPLLEPLFALGLPQAWIEQLQAVEFAPCFSVIGGYCPGILPLQSDSQTGATFWQMGDRHWDALYCEDEILAWIGLDSSKSRAPSHPILVFQSTDAFATAHIDSADLDDVGDRLLKRASQLLNCPVLNEPQWRQVHRWRYAFCRQPLVHSEPYLVTHQPLLLGCVGDWCGGNQIEDALSSGRAIAHHIHQTLQYSSSHRLP